MTTGRLPIRRVTGIAPAVGSLLVISVVAGHPAIAEVMGGSMIFLIAVFIGVGLARRSNTEADPGRHLILDLLMVAVVLLALVGMAVIGLAIPYPA